MKHPALDERAVFIDLLLDLAVGEVKVRIEERDAIVVFDRLTVDVVLVDLTAPRVTSGTGLDLVLRPPRFVAACISSRRVDLPAGSATLIKRDQESMICLELSPIAW